MRIRSQVCTGYRVHSTQTLLENEKEIDQVLIRSLLPPSHNKDPFSSRNFSTVFITSNLRIYA